ncbi:MAG: class I SAM-dependent methyltransferase [Planctomycetia bacterium]
MQPRSVMATVMEYERFLPVERAYDLPGGPLRLWLPPDMDALIDIEAFEADERIPYWANVWESAIVLAEDLARTDSPGLSLVELGCGLGLPSLVAARQGFAVTATDYEDAALEGVRFNAAKNGLGDRVSTRLIDWRTPPDGPETFDRVVAADVLYEQHHALALAGVIDRLLAADGLALVADPGRLKAAAFPPACVALGLTVETRPARRPLGATGGPAITVYAVTRPAASRAPRP